MRTADLLHDQKGLQAYWPKLNDDITRHKLHEMKFKIVFHFVDLLILWLTSDALKQDTMNV